MTALRFSRVCAGVHYLEGWLRMPPDERGFRQAVKLVARQKDSLSPWELQLEHVNEFGKVFASAGPFDNLGSAKRAAEGFLERCGVTRET